MQKIILIFQSDYPWDIRIEKFLKSLSTQYEVHLLCRNLNNKESVERITERITIHRIKHLSKKVFTEPFHLNPIWKKFIISKIYEVQPVMIIVRNLPLAKLAIKIGKKHSIPVVFDNAENYPEFIRHFSKYDNVPMRIMDRLNYFDKLEKYCVENSALTINVIEENTQRITKSCKRSNIIEIYNVPYKQAFLMRESISDIIHLGYVGALDDDKLRGTSDIIRSMQYLDDRFFLNILGDGKEKPNLIRLTTDLQLESKVKFWGNIKYDQLGSIVSGFQIGVVSHRKTLMTDTTMANKIYEYIGFGLAVLSTDAIPLKRFTEKHKIGLVYNSGDPIDLAAKVKEIVELGYLHRDQIDHRVNLHLNNFNWECESKKLMQAIDKIINNNSSE